MAPLLPIRWRSRREPLPPGAVVALGASALAERLLLRDDEMLFRLEGVAGNGVIAIVGSAEDLPWTDGAIYLGHDSAAPALLLPTTLEPDISADLLQQNLASRFPAIPQPLAVLPGPGMVIPLGAAGTVSRTMLMRWLDATRGTAHTRPEPGNN